jgi:FKBP-type peptidyl-prolyl cis-trans isomerase SlyD
MEVIEANARVTLTYTLRDEDGNVLDSSEHEGSGPIEYVHGYGMVVPGLEAALAGMRVGEKKEIKVLPAGAFGDADPELVLEVDRADFPRPDHVRVGDELIAESPDGDEVVMRVVEVKEDAVVVDANHPLAGKTLHYAVEVRDVRAATETEIEEAALAFEEAGYGADVPADAQLVQLGRKPEASKTKSKSGKRGKRETKKRRR